jgi:hypothetical protein
MRVRLAIALLAMLALFQMPGMTQSSVILGPDGKPLNIRAGMSFKEIIDVLTPEYQSYVLGGDSGWLLQIHDNFSCEEVLMSLWSHESQDYTINYAGRVDSITIHSLEYKTNEGVHVGMLLADAERKLGRIERIYTSEPTFEQYAEFANMPSGVSIGVSGGIFEQGVRETQSYAPDASIRMLTIGF